MNVSHIHNNSLRIKIISNCNLGCNFCHREGNASFSPITHEQFAYIASFANNFGYSKLHLTGGEPTLHPGIFEFIRLCSMYNLDCGITTNGQFRSSLLAQLSQSGLKSINFSLHTLNPEIWANIQHHGDIKRSIIEIDRVVNNIQASIKEGLETKVNIAVTSSPEDIIELIRLLSLLGAKIRLMDVLGSEKSISTILTILNKVHAKIVNRTKTFGSSQTKETYETDYGQITVKGIDNSYTIPSICGGCSKKCIEGFYGIRIEAIEDDILVRLCVENETHTTLIGFVDFITSNQLQDIINGAQISLDQNRKAVLKNVD